MDLSPIHTPPSAWSVTFCKLHLLRPTDSSAATCYPRAPLSHLAPLLHRPNPRGLAQVASPRLVQAPPAHKLFLPRCYLHNKHQRHPRPTHFRSRLTTDLKVFPHKLPPARRRYRRNPWRRRWRKSGWDWLFRCCPTSEQYRWRHCRRGARVAAKGPPTTFQYNK